MAHEIFGSRFLSREMPAWHRLGRVFDRSDEMTATDAISEVAGDVNIQRIPLVLPLGDQQITLKESAIVRMPTPDAPEAEVFGTVKKADYEVIQYTALGGALDPLAEAYAVETAGVLKNGRYLFIALRGESFDVKDVPSEQVKNYLTLVMSQQPGVSHRVLHTPVRVVCQNTLSYGTERASLNISIPHTAVALDTLALAAEIAAGMDDKVQASKAIFDTMANVPLDDAGLRAIIKAAFPNPKKPKSVRFLDAHEIDLTALADRRDDALFNRISNAHDRWQAAIERESARRNAAAELYARICDEHPAIGGTVYAGYQAVTELSDWREGPGDADYSVLFGNRASEKVRAYNVATELAGVNLN